MTASSPSEVHFQVRVLLGSGWSSSLPHPHSGPPAVRLSGGSDGGSRQFVSTMSVSGEGFVE